MLDCLSASSVGIPGPRDGENRLKKTQDVMCLMTALVMMTTAFPQVSKYDDISS